MECIQLRQENERLKQDLASLSQRQDHTRVLETLKAKMSAELSGKNKRIGDLEQRVRQLEAEDIRATARLDAIRERHSSEAGQLLDKLRQLMDERNRLVLTNAEQAKTIDRLRRDQENQAYTNIQENAAYNRLRNETSNYHKSRY
jgi:galactokinase